MKDRTAPEYGPGEVHGNVRLPKRRLNLAVPLLLLFVALMTAGAVLLFSGPRRHEPRFIRPPLPAALPAPVEPVAPWTYRPDGLPDKPQLRVNAKPKTIPLPPRVCWPFFPPLPSPFVLVREHLKKSQLFDLSTGQMCGEFPVGSLEGPACVSPEGTCCALHGGEMKLYRFGDAGHPLKPIDELPRLHYSAPFVFLSRDRILAGNAVLNLARGEKERELDFDKLFEGGWALTAGGEYLAMVRVIRYRVISGAKRVVRLLKLGTGEMAGELSIPVDWDGKAFGLAFSQDGKKLCCAELHTREKDKQVGVHVLLFFWDLEKGRLLKQFAVSAKGLDVRCPGLQWLPGGTAVLLGGTRVVDYEMEAIVWNGPSSRLENKPCPIIVGQHIVVLQPTRDGFCLSLVPLPMKELAQARADWAARP